MALRMQDGWNSQYNLGKGATYVSDSWSGEIRTVRSGESEARTRPTSGCVCVPFTSNLEPTGSSWQFQGAVPEPLPSVAAAIVLVFPTWSKLTSYSHHLYLISDTMAFWSSAFLIRNGQGPSLLGTKTRGPLPSLTLLFSWHRHRMPQRSPKPPRLGAGGRALQWGSNTFHQGTGAAARGRTSSQLLLVWGGVRKRADWCFSAISETSLSLFPVLSLPHPWSILCPPTSYFLKPWIIGQPPPNCSSPLVSWDAWWSGERSQDPDAESLPLCSPPAWRISLSCLLPAGFRSLTNPVRGQFSLNIYLYLWVIAFSIVSFLT